MPYGPQSRGSGRTRPGTDGAPQRDRTGRSGRPAPHLSQALGQLAAENKPGAGGTIGTTLVAQAEPDGLVLVPGTGGTLTITPAIGKEMPFDRRRTWRRRR